MRAWSCAQVLRLGCDAHVLETVRPGRILGVEGISAGTAREQEVDRQGRAAICSLGLASVWLRKEHRMLCSAAIGMASGAGQGIDRPVHQPGAHGAQRSRLDLSGPLSWVARCPGWSLVGYTWNSTISLFTFLSFCLFFGSSGGETHHVHNESSFFRNCF